MEIVHTPEKTETKVTVVADEFFTLTLDREELDAIHALIGHAVGDRIIYDMFAKLGQFANYRENQFTVNKDNNGSYSLEKK